MASTASTSRVARAPHAVTSQKEALAEAMSMRPAAIRAELTATKSARCARARRGSNTKPFATEPGAARRCAVLAKLSAVMMRLRR